MVREAMDFITSEPALVRSIIRIRVRICFMGIKSRQWTTDINRARGLEYLAWGSAYHLE